MSIGRFIKGIDDDADEVFHTCPQKAWMTHHTEARIRQPSAFLTRQVNKKHWKNKKFRDGMPKS